MDEAAQAKVPDAARPKAEQPRGVMPGGTPPGGRPVPGDETSVTAGFAETQLLENVEPAGGGDADIAALYSGRRKAQPEPGKPWPAAGGQDALRTPTVQYHAGAARVGGRSRPADPWAAPAPVAEVEDESVPYGPYAMGRPQRSGRAKWLIAGLAVVVLAGGGAGYALWRSHNASSPSQVVTDYFTDLGTDDAVSALALVEGGAKYANRSAYPFLDAAALADQSERPTGVQVTGTTNTTTAGGAKATAVAVTYLVGGTTVHQTVVVAAPATGERTASGGRPGSLVLEDPFMHLVVAASAGRTPTVNGIEYPTSTGSSGVLALPGAYSGQVAGTTLLAATNASATYATSTPANVRATISFPAPQVSDGATAAVQTAVNNALTACAQSTSPTPGNGCPFSYPDGSASMVWSITTAPQISLQVGNDGSVTFNDDGHLGVVHYEATTSGFLGFPSTATGDSNLDVSGTVAVDGSGNVAVQFNS